MQNWMRTLLLVALVSTLVSLASAACDQTPPAPSPTEILTEAPTEVPIAPTEVPSATASPTEIPAIAAAPATATATITPSKIPTTAPNAPETPTAVPTLAVPQWLPTAVPEDTPTPEPTVVATPEPRPEPTPQPEPLEDAEVDVPRYAHHASLLRDGRVLIGGGFSGVANNNIIIPFPLVHFQIIDLDTQSTLLITDAVSDVFLSSMLNLSEDRLFIMGFGAGADGEEIVGAAEFFDAAEQTITSLSPSTTPRVLPGLALLKDDRVLVVGGGDLSAEPSSIFSEPDFIGDVEIYDMKAASWQQASPMNYASNNPAVLSLPDGRVLIVHADIPTPELYDPDSDTWTPTAEMANAPMTPRAVVLSDGRVLVTGAGTYEPPGYESVEVQNLNTGERKLINPKTGEEIDPPEVIAEIYDPTTDTWALTGPMAAIRTSHTVTLLPDGRVLVTGGIVEGEGLEDLPDDAKFSDRFVLVTEIYDPATNEWASWSGLTVPRYDHTATLLPDGRIFLYGGVTIRSDIQEIHPTETSEFLSITVFKETPPEPPGGGPRLSEYFRDYREGDEAFSEITAGPYHVCALRPDGSVVCWAGQDRGETIPPEGERFMSIASEFQLTCGLRHDGTPVCWGTDENQGGGGRAIPPEDEKFTSIVVGGRHACGLRSDGVAICWGATEESYYEGGTYKYSIDPPAGERFTSLAISSSAICGLRHDGTVACWGYLTYVYRNGKEEYREMTPPENVQFSSIVGNSSGVSFCGVTRGDGEVICWPRDYGGPASEDGFTALAEGYGFCALRSDWTATCLEEFIYCGSDTPTHCEQPPSSTEFSAIALGRYFGCGLRKDDGRIACWLKKNEISTNPLER